MNFIVNAVISPHVLVSRVSFIDISLTFASLKLHNVEYRLLVNKSLNIAAGLLF